MEYSKENYIQFHNCGVFKTNVVTIVLSPSTTKGLIIMNNLVPRKTTKILVYCFQVEIQHELETLRKGSGENQTNSKMTERKDWWEEH